MAAPAPLLEFGVKIDNPGRDDDHSVRETGARLLEALRDVPGLLVRWESEDVKRRFLETRLRLPPDLDPRYGRGSPLMVVVPFVDQDERFSASLRPPVLRIGSEGWTPTRR